MSKLNHMSMAYPATIFWDICVKAGGGVRVRSNTTPHNKHSVLEIGNDAQIKSPEYGLPCDNIGAYVCKGKRELASSEQYNITQ